jgi:hypothetical protein
MYTQGYIVSGSTTAGFDDLPTNSGLVDAGSGPLWPGMAIVAYLQEPCGASLQLAQSTSQICGWTVFNGSTALVSTDESPVPSAGPNMAINFVSTGAGVRLVLQADPSVLDALEGAIATTPLSWDFQNQRVILYSPAAGQLPIKSVVTSTKNAQVIACNDGYARWESNAAAVIVQL